MLLWSSDDKSLILQEDMGGDEVDLPKLVVAISSLVRLLLARRWYGVVKMGR